MKTKTKNKYYQQTITKNNRKIKNIIKTKAMGDITPSWNTIPEMDRWEILILNLICHVNPGNEQSVT